MPPSWIFPRSLACAKRISSHQKRDNDAYRIAQRGSRNTLRLFRLSYVKYSTGANIAAHTLYRALRKPNSTVARRAFLDRWCNDNTKNVTTCFSARKRYFRVLRLFFAYFFLERQKCSQTANQRSVCCLERTSSEMDETCRLRRGEGYGACEDERPRSDSCGRAMTAALRCNRRSAPCIPCADKVSPFG